MSTFKVKFEFDEEGKTKQGTCEINAPSKEAAEDSAYAVLKMRRFLKVKVTQVNQVEESAAALPFQSRDQVAKYYVPKGAATFDSQHEWEEAVNSSGLDIESGPRTGQVCAFQGNKIVGVFTFESKLMERPYGYLDPRFVK
jgi:hypothetical protein